MTLTAGILSQVGVTDTTANLQSTAASGGTGPYTQQWYRSLTSGFTPGGGNLISGATGLVLNDSGLIPGATYYYKVIYTDTGHSNDVITSAQLTVVAAAQTLNPNQFDLRQIAGVVDLRLGTTNTVSVLIDVSQATPLYAGMAVKVVDSADGVPKVVGCAANSDDVDGYLNYDVKTVQFLAGAPAEMSMDGSVMYLFSTTAIARFQRVQLDLQLPTGGIGGVAALVPSSGADVVGYAYDKAPAAGSLIRVFLRNPSFTKA